MSLIDRKRTEDLSTKSRDSSRVSLGAPLRILFLAEDTPTVSLVREELQKSSPDITLLRAATRIQFIKELQEFMPDAILSDSALMRFTVLDALQTLRSTHPHIPFILVAESQSAEIAVECVRRGVDDYVPKSHLKRLPGAVHEAIEKHMRLRKREDVDKELRRQRDMYEEFLAMQGRTGIGCAAIRGHSHTFVYVNDAFCRISGYDRVELMSLPSFFKLMAPDKAYQLEVLMRKRIPNTEHAQTLKTTLARKSGEHVEIEMSLRQSSPDQENRCLLTIRDISEHVLREREFQNVLTALRERDEHFRLLFDGVKDYAMFMIDPAGRVMNWNSGAERIFGYTASDIIGSDFSCFFTQEDLRKRKPQNDLAKVKEGNRLEVEEWWVRKDTSKFWAGVILSLLRNQKGEPVGCSIVLHDLSVHKKTEDQLRRQGEDLRALARHLQSVREEERFRIARELHDELGQVLTALRMELSILQRRVNKFATDVNRPAFLEKITSMSQLIETTMHSVRKIVSELRPTVLDEFGLLTAIQWQAQEFENRTGIRCMVSRLQRDIDVKPNQATALFRILQEALTNVARHAEATNVQLGLEVRDGEIVLTIRDNGKGIESRRSSNGASFGLLGMEERVRVLNGRIEISGKSGEGTTIVVHVPTNVL